MTLGIKFREMGESKHEAGEDSANAFHEEFIRMRLNRMLYEQLLQVEDALQRLDSGDYGTCGGCGTPISPKRLKVIPWVKYCVPCQDKINSLYGNEEFSTEREVDYAGTSKSPIN